MKNHDLGSRGREDTDEGSVNQCVVGLRGMLTTMEQLLLGLGAIGQEKGIYIYGMLFTYNLHM